MKVTRNWLAFYGEPLVYLSRDRPWSTSVETVLVLAWSISVETVLGLPQPVESHILHHTFTYLCYFGLAVVSCGSGDVDRRACLHIAHDSPPSPRRALGLPRQSGADKSHVRSVNHI